jgi:predicted metal-binding membrane protein
MESAAIRRAPPLPALVQLGLIGLLVAAAVIAWAVTGDRMQGMDAGPGTDLGGVGWFVGVWVLMMAAMMFPAIWPMVLMYARIQDGKREKGAAAAGATSVFVAGYLVTWTAAGLVAYGIFELGRSLDPAFLDWDEGGRYIAAGVILAAAIYQLTPQKDVCLRKCRSPFMFLVSAWRPGRSGALRMGIEHGAWCVGCCWALMAALFALGVMSLAWMAVIAAFIATEKLLPWQAVANRAVTVGLLVLAIAVLAAPEDVPGLTVPGSPEANRAMEAMGMEAEAGSGAMSEEMEDDAGGSGAMGDRMDSGALGSGPMHENDRMDDAP